MRLLFELAIFAVIAIAALAVGALILWLFGRPFELHFKDSLLLSIIALCFIFPAAANLWIMFRGTATERGPVRVTAGVRGFGMLICSVALLLKFTNPSVELRHFLTIFGIGIILWWGSVPFEDYYERKRLKQLGLFREEDARQD